MPLIPDEWIERIKHEVPVLALAERAGIAVKKVGQELMARCAFHEDHTPSLAINPAHNVFQCFGCRAAGTPIDWTMREKNLSFRPAVELLLRDFFPSAAEELLDRPQRRGTRSSAPELPCPFDFSASDQEILNQYVDHCRALFNGSAEPRDYAAKRGLETPELAAHFKLGYQDRTLGLRLPTPTTKAGNEIRERFQRLGLIRESGHAHFVGSLIVPTVDLTGNVTGIYGRKTRDDLNKNHASPKHLYRTGPDDDVFNEAALASSKEIVLCEARLDALSFWRWGFKNVTSTRGAGHLSDALLNAFLRHGTEKVLIAFDRDVAGDSGARKVADLLLPRGIDCYRVLFPKGMDANDVIRKMQPADKTLALFLRSAEWMGNGTRPPRGGVAIAPPAQPPPAPPAPSSAADVVMPQAPIAEAPIEATESEIARAAAEEKVAAPSIPPGVVKLTDDEAELRFEDRRYLVRGLKKCLAFGSLRLVLKAEREGVDFSPPSPISGWHLDTLDLCSHRQRAAFEREAARELGLKEEVIRFDLGRIVRALEAVQEERIAEAQAPKSKTVTLTEGETEQALDFWKSADLFTRIAQDYTACGLVGETINKIASYVGATSRLLERPLAIIVQSSSAAGKSTLMEKTLAFMPEEMREKYTAVSGKSLFYFDETTSLRHKVLAIVEEEGAERATYPLKILQSEGELVMASTGKDPHTGKLVTKTYRVEGPVMIILTTTQIEIDPELENRCLRLTVDESREQTRAIHELQRMRMTYEGHLHSTERERIQKVHRNAQRLLRRIRVHNPYAQHLTFVSDQTRTRRDHDKYLALIETIALMHQFQRPVYQRQVNGSSEEYIDVTLEDIELAGRLVGEILGTWLKDLAPQTQRFLEVLDEMITGLCAKSGVDRSDLRFTRRQIRELTGWCDTQVRVHMSRLIELEYVLVHRGRTGQSYSYELLYAGEGKNDQPFVLGLLDVAKLRSTTSTSRGQDGYLAGDVRGVCGPVAGGVSEPETSTPPAPEAFFSAIEPVARENALIPAASKTRSYALRPFRPAGIRINLLRFPPVESGRAPVAPRARQLALVR